MRRRIAQGIIGALVLVILAAFVVYCIVYPLATAITVGVWALLGAICWAVHELDEDAF